MQALRMASDQRGPRGIIRGIIMDETQNTPIAGTRTPQDAPNVAEVPGSAPSSIPPNYTPEMAKARIAELDRSCLGGT
jgi:hypothetical protein